MIKGKKGGMADIFLFMILAIVIVFICGIFIYLGSTVLSQAHSTMNDMVFGTANTSQVIGQTLGAVNTSYQSLYWISIMLIVGMILPIFIGSYLVTTKPIFFIPYIFISIIAIITSVGLSNAYDTVITDPTIASTFTGFVGANFILYNLPMWVSVIAVVGGLIMFVRMGSKDQNLYGGGY